MNFYFHPEARIEFLDAIEYYESCEPGLGDVFSMEVRSTIEQIQSYPRTWPIIDFDIRRCMTNRFPYGILYSIESDGIVIIAVMHLHRKPDYWKDRTL
jgi:hypothetical protein